MINENLLSDIFNIREQDNKQTNGANTVCTVHMKLWCLNLCNLLFKEKR
jgi:hypothetical protein